MSNMSNLPAHSSLYAALQEVSDITERLCLPSGSEAGTLLIISCASLPCFLKIKTTFCQNIPSFSELYTLCYFSLFGKE